MTLFEDLWYGNVNPHEAILTENRRFKHLLSLMGRKRDELNETLTGILGHNGTAHVRLDDFHGEKAFFLVGYEEGEPVCCAGVRRMDERTGEVKRVYARKNRRGLGTALMKAVEDLARGEGYRRLVLDFLRAHGAC